MTIQGVTINDEEIYNAYGSWRRDNHCVIAIELQNHKWHPIVFHARNLEEVTEMQSLLNYAVQQSQKNFQD